MIARELMSMILSFLYGEYDAGDFSFDFPAKLSFNYTALLTENKHLCDLLEEDVPDICASFDPYNLADKGTFGEREFRDKILAIYLKALPIAISELVS